jgi:hypothetical protein
MQGFGDNFIPVIPVDYLEHTDEKPFCWNGSCACREDQDNIALVAEQVQEGLFTPQEATDFVAGRGI